MIRLGLMFLLSGSAKAAVPCPEQIESRTTACQPSESERAAIMRGIRSANKTYEQYQDALRQERRLRGQFLLEEDPRDVASAERRLSKLQRWKDQSDLVKRLEASSEATYNELSLRISHSYGIAPQKKDVRVSGGILRGAKASWAPSLQAEEDKVFFKPKDVAGILPGSADRKVAYLKYENLDARDAKNPEERQSATLDDGTVLISIRLFRLSQNSNGGKGDPAILAAHLAMERSRFEEKTCSEGTLSCRLQRGRDDLRADAVEIRGVNAALAVADTIGLEPTYKARLDSKRVALALRLDKAARGEITGSPAFTSSLESKGNMVEWGKYQAQLRGIRRQQGELARRLEARRRGEPEEPFLRDALNERRPPAGAVTENGCYSTGFWAGDVYIPPTPCARALPPPPNNEATPATVAPSGPGIPAAAPAPIRAIPSLYDLAARVCANPASAHSQPFHDDFRTGWWASDMDESSLAKCQHEVFIAFKKLRQEGYADYNSAYFQALAENLNMPQPPVFQPPEPEVDLPVPAGPSVPDCLRAEGRRCIRWR